MWRLKNKIQKILHLKLQEKRWLSNKLLDFPNLIFGY